MTEFKNIDKTTESKIWSNSDIIQLEIAYQLKRIADRLESKE